MGVCTRKCNQTHCAHHCGHTDYICGVAISFVELQFYRSAESLQIQIATVRFSKLQSCAAFTGLQVREPGHQLANKSSNPGGMKSETGKTPQNPGA